METVKLRHKAMQQALLTLQKGLKRLEIVNVNDSEEYQVVRDCIIQRFEYCIDTFWKFFKAYLEIIQEIDIESPSPRTILRLMVTMQLMNNEECTILLHCITERNLTSHTYSEEMAEKIQHHIPFYCATMKTVFERLKF